MSIKTSKNKKQLEYITIAIKGGFSARELAWLVIHEKGAYTEEDIIKDVMSIEKYSDIIKVAKEAILSYGYEVNDISVSDNFEGNVDEVVDTVADHIVALSKNVLTKE